MNEDRAAHDAGVRYHFKSKNLKISIDFLERDLSFPFTVTVGQSSFILNDLSCLTTGIIR